MDLLVLIALILVVIGFAAPGVGIWLLTSTDLKYVFRVTYLNKDPLTTAAILMSISLILLIATAVTSFQKKFRSNAKLVQKLHIVFTCFLVGTSLAMVIASGIFVDSIYPEIEDQMKVDVQTKYVSEWSTDLVSMSWNNMQIDWKCCGSTDYTDYHYSKYRAFFQEPVPWTCCVMFFEGDHSIINVINETACRIDAESPHLTESLYLHTKGCYPMIDSVLDETSTAALAMSCVLFVLEVVVLVISCIMLRSTDVDD